MVVFYVNPYEMLTFKNSLRLDRNTVICAYEDTYHAQRAAQEALQGRIAFEGKMPVNISLERWLRTIALLRIAWQILLLRQKFVSLSEWKIAVGAWLSDALGLRDIYQPIFKTEQ